MEQLSKRVAHVYLLLGIVVSIGISGHLYHLESASIDNEFRRELDQISAAIERTLARYFEVVHGLANALTFFDQPRPELFEELSRTIRHRHPAIRSLAWYWHTPPAERKRLAEDLGRYYGGFELRRFDGATLEPATLGAEPTPDLDALPLVALQPPDDLRRLLGLDLFSHPLTGASLREAIRRDSLYVSGSFHYRGAHCFAVFSPVFRGLPPGGTGRFTGLASATFTLQPLLQEVLQEHLRNWSITVTAPQNRSSDPVLFSHHSRSEPAAEHYRYSRQIQVGPERQWILEALPSQRSITAARSRLPQTALASGLVLTLLIYYIWISQLSRTRHIESVVAERTEALSAANRRLRALSQTDALTGVANRRLFEERLHHEWLRLRRTRAAIAMMMIDVDYFKAYNDHYGHQQGDHCLASLAQCIERTVQRPADLVARYGGEEFIVLLPQTDDSALPLASDILRAVRDLQMPHARSRVAPHVTISIGFGFARADQLESPQQLIIAADRALYHAKASGRNCVAYATAPSAAAPRLLQTREG